MEAHDWSAAGAVEVRKNDKATTWYNARILDVSSEPNNLIKVGFENKIWADREVPASCVRNCPLDKCDPGSFDPQVGEVVEVRVNASDNNPSGWSLGRVKNIKNSFHFISFEGATRTQDLIVEKEVLRKVNKQLPIDSSKLQRGVFKA